MKKMRKILSLVMIMVLALSLAGCGSNTEKQLYGTWAATFDLSGMIEDELGSDFDGFHEDFDITLMLDFNEDGTFRMYADEEALRDTFNTYLESLASFGTNVMYEQLEGNGYTRDEVDSMVEEQYGMGVEEYMLSQLQSSVDIDELIGDMETTGVYKAKGNKLYMDEVAVSSNMYDLFTVEGDTLTIDAAGEVDSEEIIEGFDYPYVFDRVQ